LHVRLTICEHAFQSATVETMEGLETLLLDFEKVVAERLPYYLSANPIARAIREIYATRSAFAVLTAVRRAFPGSVEIAGTPTRQSDLRPVLPTREDIKGAAPSLMEAVASHNQDAAVKALEKMGVLTLCPSSDQGFSPLEYSVGSIVGRVRLIPLVELARLAADLNYFANPSKYVQEAQGLSPGPDQLHHLYAVAGVVALSEGNVARRGNLWVNSAGFNGVIGCGTGTASCRWNPRNVAGPPRIP
jgi:hypothetical protein